MQRNIVEEINYQWKNGGMHIRLIAINAIVFFTYGTISVFSKLFESSNSYILELLKKLLTLNGNFEGFITHPWGLFTSIFAHFDFYHFLFNMIFLFFAGSMFLRYFDNRRLMNTYILGGLLGGIFQLLAYGIFPALKGDETYVIGASGSIMAIFAAIAFYRPNEKVMLFGIVPLRIIYIALFFILKDFFSLADDDHVAHFAHLGGAVLGFISIQNHYSKKNILTLFDSFLMKLARFFSRRSKLHVKKGGKHTRNMSDEEYNVNKKSKQQQIDVILDKISKSGYDSLTKEEKSILFDQSKNG